ncbi:aminotransferase class V-fold PLP-dependent enzyme [Flavobacteriaceae bacterium R38]|nr:aminotransferase class V-fold PLP-dependent enzyme [Flavobacteriaceae bacterium R38]
MKHQKHLFSLPDHVTYLNTAFMAPLPKTSEEAGYKGIRLKSLPYEITDANFFTEHAIVKQRFATLIDANDYEYNAIIPSASYGIANAANNIDFEAGDEILVLEDQFPSNIYSWRNIADEKKLIIKTVNQPEDFKNRGERWNAALLEAITPKTKVVTLPHVLWTDGTLFDLKAIRQKTREHDALLIIDGTQSIGAYPFSVKEIDPDALICGGYKWLLGPYSLGMAYYGDYFHKGKPIENNWMNRKDSRDFSALVNYTDEYQPKSGRFSVGESSNFVLTPMLIKSLELLIEWTPAAIQGYCKEISIGAVNELRSLGCFIEEDQHRAHHLFGVTPPAGTDMEALKSYFKEENIFVSFRGSAIRISCHLYNTKDDFDKLVACFKKVI